MLQERPLLKVAISMPSTLKEEVPTLQCTCRKEESFNTSGTQRLIVRGNARLRIVGRWLQRFAKWKEWLAHGSQPTLWRARSWR